jgi:hypothetical protein
VVTAKRDVADMARSKPAFSVSTPLRKTSLLGAHHRHVSLVSTAHAPRAEVRAALAPPKWVRVAVGIAGFTVGALFPSFPVKQRTDALFSVQPPVAAAMADETMQVPVFKGNSPLPLSVLGIRQEEFMSARELKSPKTTQYSEAEEEIMELEEDEVENAWFHNLQMLWAGLASVGGIVVLYKGGVLWERWIQEQERKDMEEEIELTGIFIDPRAVRKEEDGDGDQKKGSNGDKGGADPSGSDNPDAPPDSEMPPDSIDSLERMFGKS